MARTDGKEARIHPWLVRHCISVLRLCMGAVLLSFGFLKYFPDLSPAQGLVVATLHRLTLGLVPHLVSGTAAMDCVATLECVIGVLLIIGRWMRPTTALLLIHLVGILTPLVVVPGRMFGGPHHMPTLEGQYVLKDVVLLAAGLVLATTARATAPPVRHRPADESPAEVTTSTSGGLVKGT
ncbi:hypothetical protein [Streptomyces sp. cg36]|uniref:hypothetical protein n=1 Tax=Streptomyces sp. cg36 TaxID=3238798 RepID=UPI0034E274EF